MENLFLIGLGLFSGVASALFGIGGGVIIVPSLILAGFDIKIAIGISIIQMIFASFFGSYLNYRQNLISLRFGLPLGIGGLLGSSLSGWILTFTPQIILQWAFLCFTIFSFIKYFFSSKKHYETQSLAPSHQALLLVLFGTLVGVFSSSLGVGGGLLLAPLLGIFLGLNSKEVVPLALFFICFSSLSGAISLYSAGFVHLQEGVMLGISAMMGVAFGITLMKKLSPHLHKKCLFVIYLYSIATSVIKIF